MQTQLLNKNQKTLICIIGPTAIGKTRLSVSVARQFNTEIISCDSRQFFKELKIGAAIPTREEQAEVPHHFIGNLSIAQEYSVGDFEKDAMATLDDLFTKHDLLVMVGGSGLYEKAVTQGLDRFPEIGPGIKSALLKDLQKKGIEFLQERLRQVDEEYYAQVDIHNPVRIIRALEVYEASGKPYSYFRKNQKKIRNFQSLKIGLTAPREIIYNRINSRVDQMMENGLLEEVKSLLPYKNQNALQTVGYKELFDYLDGKVSLDFAVEEIKKNTRRYAKRQLTWYRKDISVYWFDYLETDKILDFIYNSL